MFRRGLGQPALFAIIYTSVASAIYFSLGVVAARALGLTPVVYVLAGIFFALACTTYVEGASLHQDRGGATVFARYAFNELVSFVAGWMILLDYIILIAVTSFSATNYLAAFYAPLGRGTDELLLCFAIIVYVAIRNIRGFSKTRVNRIAALVVADLGLQALVIVLGLFAFFHLDTITDTIHFGDTPTWGDTVFALGVATVSFTGLESASGLSGEVAVGRRGLKRLVGAAAIDRDRRLHRHRDRGRHRAARGRQRDVAGAQLPRRADDRHRRVLPHRLAGQHAEVHDRRGGGRDPDRRGQLGHDGPLAAGLLAVDQPPDPQRGRPPAPDAARRPTWSSPSPRCSPPG